MAFEQPIGLCGALPSSGNLSSSQYLCVVENSSGQIAVAGSSGGAILGILQNDPPAAGDGATFMFEGISKAVAGTALATPGTAVMTNASGQVIAWVSGGTNCSVGILLDTASGAGALCTVLLNPSVGKVS